MVWLHLHHFIAGEGIRSSTFACVDRVAPEAGCRRRRPRAPSTLRIHARQIFTASSENATVTSMKRARHACRSVGCTPHGLATLLHGGPTASAFASVEYGVLYVASNAAKAPSARARPSMLSFGRCLVQTLGEFLHGCVACE